MSINTAETPHMAILPGPIGNIGDRATPTTNINQQPQPLTIEEYKKRLAQKEERKITKIPTTTKPKHRRAGKLVALRRKLATLRSIVNTKNTPSWDTAREIWIKIDEIEKQLQQRKSKNKNTSLEN